MPVAAPLTMVDVVRLQDRIFELEQDSAVLQVRMSDLEQENAAKDVKIATLEENLGSLTASFLELQQDLTRQFGPNFGKERGPTPPAPDQSNEIQEYFRSGPSNRDELIEKRDRMNKKIEKRRRETMIVKNFDQNINASDYAKRFVTERGGRFAEEYGDRSGIKMWGLST